MKKVKFYSEKEIASMTTAVKSGEKLSVASKRLSKEFGRSEASVYVKMLTIAGRTRKNKAAKVQKSSDKGITLKNGFVFDFKPQRAEMYKDHVRIYF